MIMKRLRDCFTVVNRLFVSFMTHSDPFTTWHFVSLFPGVPGKGAAYRSPFPRRRIEPLPRLCLLLTRCRGRLRVRQCIDGTFELTNALAQAAHQRRQLGAAEQDYDDPGDDQ